MENLYINGGKTLNGSVAVHGAKNSALPILTACAMIKGEAVIHNCPKLSDVENTLKILRYLGAKVKREGSTVSVNSIGINNYVIPDSFMREMRSSILFLGALCSGTGRACLCLPGGCDIGSRPIDMHLNGLAALSGRISIDGEKIFCDMQNAEPTRIVLPYPSVGATENIILASVMLKGKTTVVNAAREPEISDLCAFLNGAGAKIKGASEAVIEIEGVSALHSTEHTVIPDRILASTLMSAVAAAKGCVEITHICLPHLEPVMNVFVDSGVELKLSDNRLMIKSRERLNPVRHIVTKPYPGFPTDSQSPVCAALALASGKSTITETVFENRFRYINELRRFGADITVKDNTAYIKGVKNLNGAAASCTDLRGGAAVLIAALAAKGSSVINNINHLDRGYENIEYQFNALGADIKRIKNEKERKTKKE